MDFQKKAQASCDNTVMCLCVEPQHSVEDSTIKRQLPRPRGVADVKMVALVCVGWALLAGRMNNIDEVMFRATILGDTVPRRNNPPDKIDTIQTPIMRTVPIHLELARHCKVSVCVEAVQRQITETVLLEQTGLHPNEMHSGYRLPCLFQSLLIFQSNASTQPMFNKCLAYSQQSLINASPVLLVLEIEPAKITAVARFNPSVIRRWTVQKSLERLEIVIPQLDNMDIDLREVGMMTQRDLEDIWGWNRVAPEPIERCVHEIFEKQAQAQPSALAICACDGKLTYSELNHLATQLANRLVTYGVKPDILVPLCFEKSMWTTVAMLGVLKAGGGFVLLDASLPEQRLQSIVQQVKAQLILSSISQRILSSRLVRVVVTVGPELFTNLGVQANQHIYPAFPSSIMYLSFTSGSTGTPKGAMITHSNFASALYHQAKLLGFTTESRIYDFSSYSFDMPIGLTFATFAAGGCLCVPNDQDRRNKLAKSIISLHANIIGLTPSVAQLLDPEDIPTVQLIIFVGEALHLKDIGRWWNKVRVVNIYGPSECTPYSTINSHPSSPEEATRIGKGAGQVTWVVDPEDHNCLLPPGYTGELVLEGPLIGRGYLDELEKTAVAFIESPPWLCQGTPDQARRNRQYLYKTGDLVRYNEDGSLTFVGRKDTQVKIHGQRAELGEIEYHIRECIPEVKRVAAEIFNSDNEASSSGLMAFVQLYDSSTENDQMEPANTAKIFPITSHFEGRLTERLPRYMVPTLFISLPELPMTATGKLDRIRLRQIGASPFTKQLVEVQRQGAKRQPTSRIERALQKIWSQVLAIEPAKLGLEDSFFRLGGDSIAAMKVVADAQEVGIEITVANIFENPTLGGVASQGYYLVDNALEEIPPFTLLGGGIDRALLLQDVSARYQLDSAFVEDIYPCTPLQEGLLSLSLKHQGDYVIQRILELPSTVRIGDFRKAWEEIAQSTAILRTRIVQYRDIGPLQVVLDEQIHWISTTGLDEYLEADRNRPMEMGQPLTRYALIKDDAGIYRWFVWTLHHAAYDGWSLQIITNMVDRAYRGEQLKPTRPEFKAFIKYIKEQKGEKMERYWRNALSGCDCAPFPALWSSIQQPAGTSEIRHQLTWTQTQSRGATASTLFRAGWALVVGRMTNSDSVAFGVTISGRTAPVVGVHNIAGPTIATVPLYIKLPCAQKISDYLESIQQQATAMIPFEQIGLHQIAKTCPEGRQACMFQTLLVIQPQENRSAGNTFGKWKDNRWQEWINTYALVLEIELDRGIINASFDSGAIKPWIVGMMLERLEFVINQLDVLSPNQVIADINMITRRDAEQIWEWNCTVPPPVKKFVHDMIEEQVLAQPEATAICAWDGELTYQELDRFASGVAARLLKLGDKPDRLVPLCFEKSKWAIVAMLGVLKACRGFLLLDPSLPELRLQAICHQVGSRLLLSSAANMDLSLKLSETVLQIGPGQLYIPYHDISLTMHLQPSSSVMYAVFTSGSTGVPKGVLISHENFCSALHYQLALLGFTKDSRVLDFASYAFDVAVHNAMATLAVGGCLCIPSEINRRNNIGEIMEFMQPTIANLTPTVARLLDPTTVHNLKTLILLGEPVAINDAERWWSHKVHLINTYGPAECTPISTINHMASCPNEAIQIGKGVGLVTWIADPENDNYLVPPGCVGELLLEGPLAGLGYLQDPEKTMASFIEDPQWLLEGLPDIPGRHGRLYKTGDLVQYNEDGSLTYIGRKDIQVKIRGQRVELGEVEHHVQDCLRGEASQVVAEVIRLERETNGSPVLVAFIQMDNHSRETGDAQSFIARIHPIAADIKSLLDQRLPSYMVPRIFFSVPELPMTPTGKTNRKQLRDIGQLLIAEAQRVPDASDRALHDLAGGAILETEQPAYALAQKVFSMLPSWVLGSQATNQDGSARTCTGLEDIFLHSSGLDSVNMMELMYFISQQFYIKANMQFLIDKATSIRSLAQFVSKSQTATTKDLPTVHSTRTPIPVDLMTEIRRHDSRVATAQRESIRPHRADGEHRNNTSLTILLTGANGFLGTQILRQLLEHCQVRSVIALVRGETEDTARHRVIDAAVKALWWTKHHTKKLEVWPGDLSLPHLGLGQTRWNSLINGKAVDVIIHNGAAVHWVKSYATLEATNVNSTMELLQLAVTLSHMRFVYVAGGRRWDSRDEREADIAEELSAPDNIGYSQTKFVAEAVVKRAGHRSASRTNRLIVVSPGLIIGTPTEGVANADDYIWRLAAACIRIGAYNADNVDKWLSMSDAATAATTVIDAALAFETEKMEIHIMDGMRWREFWAILGELGYRLEAKDPEDWLAAVRADIDIGRETHPLWPLAHLFRSQVAQKKERLEGGWRGRSSNTSFRLKMAVKSCAEFLVRVGFLPRSNGEVQKATPATGYGPFLRSGHR